MTVKALRGALLLTQDVYRPGDDPPEGYLAWHEWAAVQHKAGLRQRQCGVCGLWRYPQEMSEELLGVRAHDRRGRATRIVEPVCKRCQPSLPAREPGAR